MKNTSFPVKLDRPLCVFDIESTGINPRFDRVVELSMIRLDPGGAEDAMSWLLNPGVPIPEETTAIHGITDEAVRDCPRFDDVAEEVRAFIGNSDLGGFNITRFDLPLL
ncbi:MAG: 3'-5' exonuclease, partial [Kiritimatiellaeota bacterium]|nr:3'-5' exonuclease [Kiritimatiellota bacterium]